MEKKQIVLARKVINSLKRHWLKTNPEARAVLKHFQEKYGELPRPDHMAIRSISGVGFGIDEANSLFSALGYKFGNYWPIPELNITACHFEPPVADLEKIFFSVIELDQIKKVAVAKDFTKLKKTLKDNFVEDHGSNKICVNIYDTFFDANRVRRWLVQDIVEFLVNTQWTMLMKEFLEISQKPYLQELAHVLAYGFIPNHFTFLMQDPTYKFSGYTSMQNLSKEIEGLGIKMKNEIEGDENSILCQTSTIAYPGKFDVDDEQGIFKKIKWPRSYVEFIKRGADSTSTTGRYEGFLPKQAQALFKMTDKQ